MKNIVFLLLSFILFQHSFAQGKKRPLMSDEGFWVIEHNIKTPRQAVVYFYNNNKDLVYKESITGRRLNVRRNKIVRQLNAVLDQALVAWQNNQALKEGNLLAKNKR